MNPFTPTFGVSPSVVLGRESVVTRFSRSLDGSVGDPRRILLISGPRGIGKTITLNELEDAAAQHGWMVIRAHPYDLIGPLVNTIVPEAIQKVSQQDNGGRRITGISVAGIGSISTEQRNTPQPVPSLISVLNQLCDVVGDCSGVLITLDEVQSADPSELWELSSAIQDLRRDNRHIAFVAAGLPDGINALLKHPGTTFLRRAQHVSLAPMTPQETIEILTSTAGEVNITLNSDTLDKAAALTRGYPFLIQLLGFHLVEEVRSANRSIIEPFDVDAVTETVLDTLGQLVHGPALLGVPRSQTDYLTAMAEIQEDSSPVSTGQIAELLGKRPQDLTVVRQLLIERELLYSPRRGYLNFVIPHMAHHLLNSGTRDTGWD